MKEVTTEVLKKIKPSTTEQHKIKGATDSFLKKLNSKLAEALVEAGAILGGSGAKDTWLSGNHDLDIFVRFDLKQYSSKSTELSKILEKLLKKTFPKQKLHKLHGSRDYFQITYQNYNFEIIPILKINKVEEAVNITDISPLHILWVNKSLKKLKDEVRVAKQFCRAHRIYGAESHISGFSGYVLEILIAHYGSFENLLKFASSWKFNEVIDPEGYYRHKDVFFHLNKSKLVSPLIIIDPVDKNRNAAAALSEEKFMLFKKLARTYLERPDTKYFEKKEFNLADLKKETEKRKLNLVFMEITPLIGKTDVVGAKLLKAFNFIKQNLDQFVISESGWNWDQQKKAVFYFILKQRQLPATEVRLGPPIELKQFVKDFKKKNKEVYEEKGRLFARIKVKYPQLGPFIKNILKDKYLKDKWKKVNLKID